MREMGLFLDDLSMHDQSREMVLKGWEHCSRSDIPQPSATMGTSFLQSRAVFLIFVAFGTAFVLLFSLHIKRNYNLIMAIGLREKKHIFFFFIYHIAFFVLGK